MSARRGPVIAIDGPAASGKSTVAAEVSRRLGLEMLDSGSMYRAVTLLALEDAVNLSDERSLVVVAKAVRESFHTEHSVGGRLMSYLGDRDVTSEVRSMAVGNAVSIVSAVPGVRREMVELQRAMVAGAGAVAEGRDIGTVVFPDAVLKVFLDAAPGERAGRRYRELVEKGKDVVLEEVAAENSERDRIDSSRADSPLAVADDAVHIDTTSMTVSEVVDRIIELCKRKMGSHLEL